MSGPATETWYDSVGLVFASVEGIKAVYAGGKGSQLGVYSLPRSLPETPCIVLFYAGGPVIAGSWERNRRVLEGAVYLSVEDFGDAHGELVKYDERILAATAARGKAFGSVDSLVVTAFRGIEDRTWSTVIGADGQPIGKPYLALPFDLEVVFNVARTQNPA